MVDKCMFIQMKQGSC